MYEVNTHFSMSDRSQWLEDIAPARQWYLDHGATDVKLCDLVSSAQSGTFLWTSHFETLDAVIASRRAGVSLAAGDGDLAALRARYDVLATAIMRVNAVAGERRGPCWATSSFSVAKMPADADSQNAVDAIVAAGAHGAQSTVAIEGPTVGSIYVTTMADSFDHIEEVTATALANPDLQAAMAGIGAVRQYRWLWDVS